MYNGNEYIKYKIVDHLIFLDSPVRLIESFLLRWRLIGRILVVA